MGNKIPRADIILLPFATQYLTLQSKVSNMKAFCFYRGKKKHKGTKNTPTSDTNYNTSVMKSVLMPKLTLRLNRVYLHLLIMLPTN